MSSVSQTGPVALRDAVQRYFEVALYLLVLTGFGTLAAASTLDSSPLFLLLGAGLLFRGYLLAKRKTFLIPENWTNVLTAAYVAVYLADFFLISGTFLTATVHLLLFVMVVRLFSAQRDRDYYFLAVISFLMVLAASILTVNSIFLAGFAAFLIAAMVSVILMEMRNAARKATVAANEPSDPLAYRKMGFSLAGTTPVLVVLVLLGAAGIFFLLPRVSTGYLSSYASSNALSTGFSDQIQLGSIGQIQQSRSVVMHVEIDGDQSGRFDLKWRGMALSVFDGKSWSNIAGQRPLPRTPDGQFALHASGMQEGAANAEVRPELIHYRVLMEPTGVNVFFLAPWPRSLEGNYRVIGTDSGGAVVNMDPEHPLGFYQAWSNIAQPQAAWLRQEGNAYPKRVLAMYLQLPPLDPRIPALAEEITQHAGNSYDKAEAIDLYLKSHFQYTLELPSTPPQDPLATFLFERKRGHCEYFASSMAIMLRTLRIPTRVVTGFRGGEFNDVTSQYVLRASDAHAWVEVYFPEYGWISFDPTPAGSPADHSGWNRAALYLDAMASFWREWVVNYDSGHQQALSQDVVHSSRKASYDFRRWMREHYESWLKDARQARKNLEASPARWVGAGVLSLALLLLAANARKLWRMLQLRRLAAHPEQSPSTAASIWYQRMVRHIARRGWTRRSNQTAEEFLASIGDDRLRGAVGRFTRHYQRARFAGSPEDARRLPELYEEISSALRG
ncbi:MAG: DUF3488 domain-containing protein [Acidobacteria bacterium]|nr:DUF3488 domain-containing protein [Acidobacteriota bacterium]